MSHKIISTKCSVNECELNVRRKGLCEKHYSRLRRHNDVHHTAVIIGDNKKRLKNNCVTKENGCWEWNKFKKLGYGVTCLNGKLEQAHRASWKVFIGEIPKGSQVNHVCHNRACINPDHLYCGSQKQNMEDMKAAGRESKAIGERNGNSKLSTYDVIEIKHLIAKGFNNKHISTYFNVSEGCIQFIRIGRTWTGV